VGEIYKFDIKTDGAYPHGRGTESYTFESEEMFFGIKITVFYLALDIPPQRRNDAKKWRNRGQIHRLNKRENAKRNDEDREPGGDTFGCKILDDFQLAASGRRRTEKLTTF
jgi:hypothetical protein